MSPRKHLASLGVVLNSQQPVMSCFEYKALYCITFNYKALNDLYCTLSISSSCHRIDALRLESRANMAARIRRARNAIVGATGATLLLGEAAERYDDAHRVAYAAQNLRNHLRAARTATATNTSDSKAENQDQAPETPASPASTAWISNDKPRFPYLLGISPGDNTAKVIGTYVALALLGLRIVTLRLDTD